MTPPFDLTKQIEAIEKGARQAREVWLYNDDDYRSSEEVFIDYYRQEITNLISELRERVEGRRKKIEPPGPRGLERKLTYMDAIKAGYNQALSDFLSLLDGKEE